MLYSTFKISNFHCLHMPQMMDTYSLIPRPARSFIILIALLSAFVHVSYCAWTPMKVKNRERLGMRHVDTLSSLLNEHASYMEQSALLGEGWPLNFIPCEGSINHWYWKLIACDKRHIVNTEFVHTLCIFRAKVHNNRSTHKNICTCSSLWVPLNGPGIQLTGLQKIAHTLHRHTSL